MRNYPGLALFVLVVMLVAAPMAMAVDVPGNANIFGAGHAVPPAPAGGGAGVLPVQVPLSIAAGDQISFPTITGLVNEGSGLAHVNSWFGAEGFVGPSDYSSLNGIAGTLMPNRMPLLGVFLGTTEPGDPSPARLDFNSVSALNFSTLSPAIGQIFFIGDGRTDQTVLQMFIAPSGATRLFLGFADADSHQGAPGFYGDNQGLLSVTVPEPSAVGLACLMLAAGAGRFRHVKGN